MNNDTSVTILFQRNFGLRVTGIADRATLKLINTPRCGVKDNNQNHAYSSVSKWSKNDLSYFIYNYSPDLRETQIR